MPIKLNSVGLHVVVGIGWLVIALGSQDAAAQDAAAQDAASCDVYGRPLADQLGRIHYRHDGQEWIAIHADGSQGPAAPIVSVDLNAPPALPDSLGYSLDPYSRFPVGSYPSSVAIGDVTGDGHADVLMTTTSYFDPVNDYSLFVFPQSASGTFGTPSRFPYLVQSNLAGLVLADLDENGVEDAVVGHNTGITVFLANGLGSLRPGVVILDADATVLQATDVDRDGHVDIVSLGQTRGGTIFFGDGHGGFPRRLPLATHANGFNDFEVGDLNGDGLPDVAVLDGATSPTLNLSVHHNNGAGGFTTPPDTYLIDSSLFRAGLGVGDITGDGLNDAVASRPRNTPTWLWIMTQDGSGGLTGPTPLASYDIPEPVVVTDVDRDGRADVVVLHGGWTRIGVYRQGTDGRLDNETLYPITYASHYPPQGLAVGDFTSDGCPDVAIADYNSGLVVLHGRGCVPHCATESCDDLNPCTDDSCDPATGCAHANNTNRCDDGNACTTNDTCGAGDCHGGGSNTCAGTLGMFTQTTGVTVFHADTDIGLAMIRIRSPRDCSVDAAQMLGFVSDSQSAVWLIDLTKTPPRLATGVNPIPISNNAGDTTISPDQRYLLVCGGMTVSVVDIALRREIGTVPIPSSCTSLEACTDGSVIVTSSSDRKVRRFTLDGTGRLTDTGEQLTTPFLGPYNSICAPRSRTGIYLAGETMGSFGIPGTVPIDSRSLSNYTFSGALNRTGNRLFLRAVNQVMAYAYDETTGSLGSAPIFSFFPNVNSGGYPGADEIAVHPDGTKFYTLGSAPAIKMNVYSTASGQQMASIPAEGYPSAICFRSMECAPGEPFQCDDGDLCTADGCDANGKCLHTSVVCNDGNACTDGFCNPATGACTYSADDTNACSDGNGCTQADTCHAGVCTGSNPVDCAGPCPAGSIAVDGGCQKSYDIDVSMLDGLDDFCDESGMNRFNCSGQHYGFHWTDGGVALGPVGRVDVQFESGLNCGGAFSGVNLNGVAVGNFTPVGDCSCDPVHGTISLLNVSVASYETAGLNVISIIPDVECAGLSRSANLDGHYARVTVTYLGRSEPCSASACDPSTGGCSYTDLPDGAACTDGDACTENDTCGNGTCHAGPAANCDDGNCCTVDSCDPSAGCTHSGNTSAPVFTIQPSLGDCPILWPPNHAYSDFTIAQTGAAASSTCGIASIQFASCSSSQPENGTGTADGNTTRDCVYEPYVLHLRAERDGACSPIGRGYEIRLVAIDVCGNNVASDTIDVGVFHDRGHSPSGGTVYSGSNDGSVSGTNGSYGAGCGGGNTCATGAIPDESDADPEMEIAQSAAISVNDLRLTKSGNGLQLTWSTPLQQRITRYHVWALDPIALRWTRIAGDLDERATSYLDPAPIDGPDRDYKVTAVIK